MEIAAINGIGTVTPQQPTTAESAAVSSTVDYQSFLRLLIAQLQNQDPLNPVESTEYMAQLAAFSNVEQSVQTNLKLDSLLSLSTLSQADSLIGKNITSSDGETSGVVASIALTAQGGDAVLESGERLPIGPGIVIE